MQILIHVFFVGIAVHHGGAVSSVLVRDPPPPPSGPSGPT